jgi:hypothetical protein
MRTRCSRRLALALSLLAAVVAAPPALAVTPGAQLDQSAAGAVTTNDFVSRLHAVGVGQTFTAGRSGLLTDVVVRLSQVTAGTPGAIQAQITAVAGGVPDTGAVLATESLGAAIAPAAADYEITFSSPPTVQAGTQYGLVLSEVGGVLDTHTIWDAVASATYAGGDGFLLNPGASASAKDYLFETYVLATAGPGQVPTAAPPPSRAAYCAAPGNSDPKTGLPIAAGTFIDLVLRQPAVDSHYAGATPAIYVEGKGLTCDPPPPGFRSLGLAAATLGVQGDLYPYFAP